MASGKPFSIICRWDTSKVFIGDICYALDKEIYGSEWLEKMGAADGRIGDQYAVVGGTAYGDGEYEGDDGVKYAVDAGVIGVTNLLYRRQDDMTDEVLNELGKVVFIPSGLTKVYFKSENGVFNIVIEDASTHETVYEVTISTYEEETYTCDCCGAEIEEWEYNRYGGMCQDCYAYQEDNDEDYDEEEDY